MGLCTLLETPSRGRWGRLVQFPRRLPHDIPSPGALWMSVKYPRELLRFGTSSVCSLGSPALLTSPGAMTSASLGYIQQLCHWYSDTLLLDSPNVFATVFVCMALCLGIWAVSYFVVLAAVPKSRELQGWKCLITIWHKVPCSVRCSNLYTMPLSRLHGCWQNSLLIGFSDVSLCSVFLVSIWKIPDSKV